MTWLNNAVNNEPEIKSKLNIDITKLYWDGSPYGALFWGNGDANLGGNLYNYHMTALRFNQKKVICGNDFVSTEKSPTLTYNRSGLLSALSPWSAAGAPFDFIINTSTFNIQEYIYEIKANFNWKGFNANITDNNIYQKRQSSQYGLSSGLSCLLFNDNSQNPSTLTYPNNFAGGGGKNNTSLQYICTSYPAYGSFDGVNPKFQSIRSFGRGSGVKSISFQNPSSTAGSFRESSSASTSDSFYWFPNSFSLHNKNINGNQFPNSVSISKETTSNNYLENVINPYNHGYFEILISKEYCSKYNIWFGEIGTTSPFYASVSMNTENVLNSFWLSSDYPNNPQGTGFFYFPYLSFVIFSNHKVNSSGTTAINYTPLPFMYSNTWQIPNDAISNVEIIITRIPRKKLYY